MKITYSIHHYLDARAGAPGSILALGENVRNFGNSVSVVGYDSIPSWMSGRFAALFFPFWFALYARKISKSSEVIDASTGDAWVFGLIRNRNGPLLVTHSHGLEHVLHDQLLENVKRGDQKISWKYPIYNGGWRLWEVGQSLRNADLCLFLNNYDLEYAVKNLRVNPGKCRVVANGVDKRVLESRSDLTPPVAVGALHIAQLGSYIPRKGIVHGAKALARFLFAFPGARVDFIGTGCPPERVLADFDQSLHARIGVISHFNRAELPKLLAGSHVLLFPSLSEGFPLALGEAMALGLAPIASNIPGVTEIVQDHINGFLVPVGDVDKIVEALTFCATDLSHLQLLREASRLRASAFGWPTVAGRRLEIYKEFIANKMRARGRKN